MAIVRSINLLRFGGSPRHLFCFSCYAPIFLKIYALFLMVLKTSEKAYNVRIIVESFRYIFLLKQKDYAKNCFYLMSSKEVCNDGRKVSRSHLF